MRVALYSHDTCGLGHLRRNTLLATKLLSDGIASSALLISGAPEAMTFSLPDGLDVVTLPAVRKHTDGSYYPRRLGVTLEHLTSIRSEIADAALRSFRPDLLIVDNVPRGANGEMEPALRRIAWMSDTRVVLGLRDVLDAPKAVHAEWSRLENFSFVREIYDDIWVYGDPAVFALADAYNFPEDLKERVRYTGYLDRTSFFESAGGANGAGKESPEPSMKQQRSRRSATVCLVGGGQDGYPLAEAFVKAARRMRSTATVVTGPYMPEEDYTRLVDAARGSRVIVHRFLADTLAAVRQADRVVTMGGYNTLCEVLSDARDVLVVPRVEPRAEQLIRSRMLERLGLVAVLDPSECTPDTIEQWLRSPRDRRAIPNTVLDFDGLGRIAAFAAATGINRPKTLGASA